MKWDDLENRSRRSVRSPDAQRSESNCSVQGEKYLVLKKKYRQTALEFPSPEQIGSPLASSDIVTPVSPLRVPPPYRPPPPAPLSPSGTNSDAVREESCSNFGHEGAAIDARKNGVHGAEAGFSTASPPVPPRRKSQDKIKLDNKENVDRNRGGSEAAIKVSFPLHVNGCEGNVKSCLYAPRKITNGYEFFMH